MPDAYVQINEGSGKKLAQWERTIGADTIEEAKIVVSEPFLAAYTITPTSAVSIATAASHVLQIMAGASLRVALRRLKVTQLVNGSAATRQQWQLWRLTTAGTGGTAVTPAKMDPADGAAGCTAMTLPTAKGTEGTLVYQEATLVEAATPAANASLPLLDYEWDGDRTKSIVIAAGTANGLALKNVSGVTSATVVVYVEVVELSWS